MIAWKNLDTLSSFHKLEEDEKVNLAAAMAGENGAQRVKGYSVPMGAGMDFNFGAEPWTMPFCPTWLHLPRRLS